jgi:soluble lytic murein transglycosylase-like protein
MSSPAPLPLSSVSIDVSIGAVGSGQRELSFAHPFRIGRSSDCDVCIENDYVSRVHAEVIFQEGFWWIRDLNSSNGLYVDGKRVERIPFSRATVVRFGVEGPGVIFSPRSEPQSTASESTNSTTAGIKPGNKSARRSGPLLDTGSGTVLRKYVEHYFSKSSPEASGEHTMYVRRAFAKVQSRQRRTYIWIISILLLSAFAAGGYALYINQQLQHQRAMAKDLFYAMKSLDVDMANLENAVARSGNQQDEQIVRRDASRRRDLENSYDQYLASLHIYDPKMTEQERIILRIARIFGECELEMPPDFVAEINRYIKLWQSSNRLPTAIRLAQQSGYVETISKELLAQGLPPQFFYLALQESNFDPYASGPPTRKGIAKGMWQFIPETAIKYGLRPGPLADSQRPDPSDERDQYEKATKAAARYLKDLYGTDAQASGFLVMACYNWGENQVLPLVRSLPANPRERNFWQLLAHHRDQIPQETYDYVFYIVSAAVIGENPRLFGFDFDDPLAFDYQAH